MEGDSGELATLSSDIQWNIKQLLDNLAAWS